MSQVGAKKGVFAHGNHIVFTREKGGRGLLFTLRLAPASQSVKFNKTLKLSELMGKAHRRSLCLWFRVLGPSTTDALWFGSTVQLFGGKVCLLKS